MVTAKSISEEKSTISNKVKGSLFSKTEVDIVGSGIEGR